MLCIIIFRFKFQFQIEHDCFDFFDHKQLLHQLLICLPINNCLIKLFISLLGIMKK